MPVSSTQNFIDSPKARIVYPSTQERIMFRKANPDPAAAAITDPYAATYRNEADSGTVAWAVIAAELHETNGRLLVNGEGHKSLELGFGFTTAGASVTFQVFGFLRGITREDLIRYTGLVSTTLVQVPTIDSAGPYLGASYSLTKEATGNDTQSVTATTELNKLAFPTSLLQSGMARIPAPDQTNGTTYYNGVRQLFRADFYAYLVHVTAISAGTAMITGRTF